MSRKNRETDIAEEEVMDAADIETPEEDVAEDKTDDKGRDDAVDKTDGEAVKLSSENAELKEQILRMAAENQNTRKRLVKQQQDAYKYRHQDILRDLAEVIDNFERAIESSADSRDFDSFHEGILMIEKQFSGMLTERYGLERIGVEGEAYDPAIHEAMMSVDSPDVERETVKQVYQSGYRLHDRILRPAKVVVAKPADSDSEQNEDAQDAEDGEK